MRLFKQLSGLYTFVVASWLELLDLAYILLLWAHYPPQACSWNRIKWHRWSCMTFFCPPHHPRDHIFLKLSKERGLRSWKHFQLTGIWSEIREGEAEMKWESGNKTNDYFEWNSAFVVLYEVMLEFHLLLALIVYEESILFVSYKYFFSAIQHSFHFIPDFLLASIWAIVSNKLQRSAIQKTNER